MKSASNSNFLRRTAVALATVAGFFANEVSAQAVTLSTGASCTYSSMSVQPNGSVSVTCSGSPPPPPPPNPIDSTQTGYFGIGGPASMPTGTSSKFNVTRNAGTAGDAIITYVVTGGCTASGAPLSFPNGGTTSQMITVTAPGTVGSCTVSLNPPAGNGQLGTPSSMSVTITQGTGTQQAGCPAAPNNVLDFELKLSGADVQRMESGRIASAVLPIIGIRASGQVVLGEATTSPRGAAVVEISISRCRGEINTNGGSCYLRTDNPTFTTMTWLENAKWGASTDGIAATYNLCKAYTTDGTFYVNMRYTYSQCNYGTCGFVSQWNYGAW